MGVKVKVKNHWGELADALPDRCATIAQQTTQIAYDYSQMFVPVLSGHLKSTGAIAAGRNRYEKILKYTAPYAEFVEYGTRFMAAEPYITPAMEHAAQRMQEMINDLFAVVGGL